MKRTLTDCLPNMRTARRLAMLYLVLVGLALCVTPLLMVHGQPAAGFHWELQGFTVYVDADDDSAGLSYSWSFGDGGIGSGHITSHTYAQVGDYTITLTVTDNLNNSASFSRTIYRVSFDGSTDSIVIPTEIPAIVVPTEIPAVVPTAVPPPRIDPPEGVTTNSSGSRGAAVRSVSSSRRYSVNPLTCQTIAQAGIHVTATTSGTQCQVIDSPAGIGNQAIIDAGPIAAVDVWGNVGLGTQVCFIESGDIVLLDASTSPRSIVGLNVYLAEIWTCAQIDGAGTVVLVPGDPPVADVPDEPVVAIASLPPVVPDDSPMVNLSVCVITTSVELNFRSGPGGQIIGAMTVPRGTTLSADTRTDHWFYVEYDATMGWISAKYVDMLGGDCVGETE